MGAAQPACRCDRGGADADDRDADSTVQAVVDSHDKLVSASAGEAAAAPESGQAPKGADKSPGKQPRTSRQASPQRTRSPSKASSSGAASTKSPSSRASSSKPSSSAASEPKPRRASSAGPRRRRTESGASEAASASAGGAEECPGMKLAAKVKKTALTPLQKVKKKREEESRKAKEMLSVVDDIMEGKCERETSPRKQPAESLRIRMPTKYERDTTRMMLLETFRMEYRRIRETKDALALRGPDQKVAQYSQQEVDGLSIKDGHRSMPRPQNVDLPKDFRKPVGTLSLKALNRYSCHYPRKLLSVYGDIFDVSDRPDKYGEDGPYSWMTGNDISWGFVSGKDVPEEINKFYDMWKIAPESLQQRKLTGLLAWVAFYEHEYGGCVGRLAEYEKEPGLKGPPIEECEECCIM